MSLFLIAEDEKPLAKAIEHKLLGKQHTVLLAESGDQVFEILKEKQPDAILLDLIMPNTDGFAVLTKLQQEPHAPPIIVSSNLAQPEDKRKVLSLGAHSFISKADASLEDIVSALESLADPNVSQSVPTFNQLPSSTPVSSQSTISTIPQVSQETL